MQGEGISRKTDGNAVIRRHVDCGSSWSPNALHGHMFRGQRNAMFSRPLDYLVYEFLVGGVGVGTAYRRNCAQIVLKRIVG